MSDYDRGAYTPQTDAPLAFDPRRPSERRPMPMALIGSGVVLVILLAGVAMVYRGGVRHAGDSPRPVGEPVMAVKTAPPPAPAASSPPANMDVYSEAQGNTTAAVNSGAAPAAVAPPANTVASVSPEAPATGAKPTFTAPAEQPAPRPAPKAATVAMLSKPTAPDHIVRPATPSESTAATEAAKPAETAPAEKTAAKPAHPARKLDQAELAAAGATRTVADAPSAADEDAAPKIRKPAKAAAVKTAAATAAPAPSAAALPTGGKAVVQIGAFSSSELADKGYAAVSAALPGRMGGKAKHVQPLDKDGTTLYRTWLSGFASREDAVSFCEALKAKGKTCLVKG